MGCSLHLWCCYVVLIYPSTAVVDMLYIRHSIKVIFIGATIMDIFVSVFVIYVNFYCYWITTL